MPALSEGVPSYLRGIQSDMRRFAFRFDRLYRVLGLPFGVTPNTTVVRVDNKEFMARFGPWKLRTPIGNVAVCRRIGPFARSKTVGPARLSLADHGLTFATSHDGGLCVRFGEPVPAIDPLGLIRHPALTVTVDDLDGLEEALGGPTGATEPDWHGAQQAHSPWNVLALWMKWPSGVPLTTLRYLRAHQIERSFEHRTDDAAVSDDDNTDIDIQNLFDGAGATYERTYRVRIADSACAPETLIDELLTDLNRASPEEVASFEQRRKPDPTSPVGEEYAVRMPTPWKAPVRITDRTPTSFRLTTLRGHMEAGSIEFTAHRNDEQDPAGEEGDLVFEIRSVAKSGTRLFSALYDLVPVIREMQVHLWLHYCREVATLAGGQVAGKVEARTIRHTN